MDLNQLSITGRLTRDPELRTSGSGNSYSFFTIACNYNKDKSYFFSCVCYGAIAENLVKNGRKGTRVVIGGYLQQTKDRDSRDIVQISASVVIIINEAEAKENLAKTKESIREKREEEKREKQYQKDYGNPMSGINYEDISDDDLPF